MSGFLLIAGPKAERWADERSLQRACLPLRARGTGGMAVRRTRSAVAVAVTHEWQRVPRESLLAERDGLLVVADAALYYRQDLLNRLSGETGVEDTPAGLIAAAFRSGGAACLEWLEGDFAFAIWDATNGRLFAARDPFGTRSLFYSQDAESCAVSSVPDSLRVVMGERGVDRHDLMRALTMYHGDGTSTPWRGITELPAGWSLAGSTSGVRSARYWYPQRRPEWSSVQDREAGVILAGLIRDAFIERMDPNGAAIGMSGGRDSTAIVGAVEAARHTGARVPALKVLSLRYPEGDPGNEDTYVNEVAARLQVPVEWLDTDTMPVLRNAVARADRRVRPEPHVFEGQNRALAAATRRAGLRVLLNGNGGDNLFGLNHSWLSDLFRTFRWVQLSRELKEKGYRHWRHFRDVCVRPAIPLALLDAAEKPLGRRILSRPWEHHSPPWLRAGAAERETIVEQDRAQYARDIASVTRTLTDRQRLWAFTYSGFSRNCAALYDLSLDEGVELRMPFYDRRVADFAWSRPPRDLTRGHEFKVILRLGMQGLLPDHVIAARSRKTGTSDSYFRRMVEREFGAVALDAAKSSRLADIGLVEPAALMQAVHDWMADDRRHELFLFITVCVELWLRAQEEAAGREQSDRASQPVRLVPFPSISPAQGRTGQPSWEDYNVPEASDSAVRHLP